MREWLWLPELASEHGARLDHVTGLVHILMLVLFVGWGGLYLYMLLRFNKKANPQANYHGFQGTGASWVEGAVFVAEVVLLAAFSIPLWAERVDQFPPEQDATVVRVVGEQFAWNVHYPGPDGKFGRTTIAKIDVATNPLGLDRSDPDAKDDVTTVNLLHVPVNKPVIVHLSSKDVIHSFGTPELRVKQDAVPGMSIPLWFIPTVTTEDMRKKKGKADWEYEIACAQLCGIGHYRMRGFVTVHTAQSFAKWMEERQAEAAAEGDGFW
jgi:cytochrome c oxidase subunit 2